MTRSPDHDLAEWRFGSGHQQKKKQRQKNKSCAEQEPRSAHDRAVNKINSSQSSKVRFIPGPL